MRSTFEDRFKIPNDGHTLLVQLSWLRKEIHEPMRKILGKLNKILHNVPTAKQTTPKIHKGFFDTRIE